MSSRCDDWFEKLVVSWSGQVRILLLWLFNGYRQLTPGLGHLMTTTTTTATATTLSTKFTNLTLPILLYQVQQSLAGIRSCLLLV